MRKFAVGLISFQILLSGQVFAQQGTVSTSALAKSSGNQVSHRYSGSLTTSLENAQIVDADTRANVMGLSLGADIQYQPTEILRVDLSPRFYFETGYVQSDENEEAQKSKLTVRNASALMTPIVFAQFEAGAVDQSRVHNELLLDNSPFPAVVARLRTADKKDRGFSAEFVTEYAIPTSSSLSSNTSELEKTPSFTSAGGNLEFSNSMVVSHAGIHYFQFKDIPGSVANTSGLAGNTVEALAGTSRKFTYEYAGLSASLATKVRLSKRFLLSLSADLVNNQKAPTSLSQGYRASIKGLIRLNSISTLIPEYEFFRLEPDAYIAAFADSKYQTNRAGYRTGLGYQYKKAVRVAALIGERVPLFESTTQSREKTLDLTLETSHALF